MGFSKKSNNKKKTGKRFTRRSGKKLKMTSKRRGSKRTKGGWPFGFGEPSGVMLIKDLAPELYNHVEKIITSKDDKDNNKVQRLVKRKKTNKLSNSPLLEGTFGPLDCEKGCSEKAILLTDEEVKMFKDNNIEKIYKQISIPNGPLVNVYYVKYNPVTNEIVKNENFDAEVAEAKGEAVKADDAIRRQEAKTAAKEAEEKEKNKAVAAKGRAERAEAEQKRRDGLTRAEREAEDKAKAEAQEGIRRANAANAAATTTTAPAAKAKYTPNLVGPRARIKFGRD